MRLRQIRVKISFLDIFLIPVWGINKKDDHFFCWLFLAVFVSLKR